MVITESMVTSSLAGIKLIGSGWKPVSMVDVYNSVTFTVWLCGCNLRCPFCHNWRLAINDIHVCHRLDLVKLVDELESAKPFIDYLHITGGEPLTQYRDLKKFLRFVKDNIGVDTSINTNLTLYKPLIEIMREGLVDHLATDLKIPYYKLYGYPENISSKLWNLYLRSLEAVKDYNIPLELRILVTKHIDRGEYMGLISEALKRLNGYTNYYVIIQPLLGPPITTPRNEEWCRKHCDPEPEVLDEVAEILRELGVERVIVRRIVSLS